MILVLQTSRQGEELLSVEFKMLEAVVERENMLLSLIRRYLQSGVMEGGVVFPRAEGTPQGGPLSPLLSNILLDDLEGTGKKRACVLPLCR